MEKDIHAALIRDERINRYLKGQMNSDEEMQFLANMQADEELKKDAITRARLIKGMRQVDEELVLALKEISETEITTASHSRRSQFLKKHFAWLSIAASIILLIFVGYKGYDYYNVTRLGMRYATIFPIDTLVRGDSDLTIETELSTLFNNVIERKNLSLTTNRLFQLWEVSNQDTYNDYTNYAPYIGWYLAIGYLENYEKGKAIHILRQMNNNKEFSPAIISNAINLLNKLQ